MTPAGFMRFRASVEHSVNEEWKCDAKNGKYKYASDVICVRLTRRHLRRELGQRANRRMRFSERGIFNRSDFLPERAYAAGNVVAVPRKFYPKYTENDCA